MKIFTFQNIVGFIFSLLSALTLTSSIKGKKALGEMLRPTLGGFKYTDKSQITLITLCIVMWFFSFFNVASTAEMTTFLYVFLAAMVVFLISAIISISIKPGFYKNGIATGSSVLLYKDVQVYEVFDKKNNPDVAVIYFNQRGKFFGSGVRVTVDKKELGDVKKWLKKECSFKG